MITIREMQLEELGQVIPLYFEGLKRELDLFSRILPGKEANTRGLGELTHVLLGLLREKEGQIFVASEDNSNLVGYCLVTKKLYPAESPQLYGCINGIYLHESHRRQGLGSRLLKAGLDWLKLQNVKGLELYHVINDEGARAFWEKQGFKTVQATMARWL